MQVPESVIKAAHELVSEFGANFQHLGDYKGHDAWLYVFPEGQYTGYPTVYLAKDNKAEEIFGEAALEIVCSFNDEQ